MGISKRFLRSKEAIQSVNPHTNHTVYNANTRLFIVGRSKKDSSIVHTSDLFVKCPFFRLRNMTMMMIMAVIEIKRPISTYARLFGDSHAIFYALTGGAQSLRSKL